MLETLRSIAPLLALMALLAALETVAPLQARRRLRRLHTLPNLALTAITFAVNALLTGALVAGLVWLEARQLGLLRAFALPVWAVTAAAVVALDLATYAAHVAMHRVPAFWRCHRVHHADPLVDVTTSIRQHPGETAIRAAFLAAVALPLGVGPAAFVFYRTLSALQSALEHSNLRMPRRLDSWLAWLVCTPNMHKVHHSRAPELTDTNFGNLFSAFDRLRGCFTPTEQGLRVSYGLEGFDAPEAQTTRALLLAPFASTQPPADVSGARGAEVAAST